MHKIDSIGATPSGEFQDRNIAEGIIGTRVTADWLNSVQRELVAVIIGAGEQPEKGNDTQLRDALNLLIEANGGGGGGGGSPSLYWLNAVGTPANLPGIAQNGSIAYVRSDGSIYRYNGTAWVSYYNPATGSSEDTNSKPMKSYPNIGDLPTSGYSAGTLALVVANSAIYKFNGLDWEFYLSPSQIADTILGLDTRLDTSEDSIQDAVDAIAVLDTRLDSSDISLAGLDTRLDTAESSIVTLDSRLDIAEAKVGVANGIAPLNALGKLDEFYLPNIAITNTFVVGSQAQMTGLAAETGDVAIRTDTEETYILVVSPAQNINNWEKLRVPNSAPVQSVNGLTGNVSLSADNIVEGTTNKYFTSGRVTTVLATYDVNSMGSTALGIFKGGTGASTAQGARTALLPSQTGANGKVLQSNGTDVSWITPSTASPSADLSTATGTLAVENGGTASNTREDAAVMLGGLITYENNGGTPLKKGTHSLVRTVGGPFTVALETSATHTCKWAITDQSKTMGTNALTVTAPTGKTINGASSYVMNKTGMTALLTMSFSSNDITVTELGVAGAVPAASDTTAGTLSYYKRVVKTVTVAGGTTSPTITVTQLRQGDQITVTFTNMGSPGITKNGTAGTIDIPIDLEFRAPNTGIQIGFMRMILNGTGSVTGWMLNGGNLSIGSTINVDQFAANTANINWGTTTLTWQR